MAQYLNLLLIEAQEALDKEEADKRKARNKKKNLRQGRKKSKK